MASYIQRDILQYDDGELDLSSGDIQIAGVRQSQRQLLINLLSTTRGAFRHDPKVGWGCERYIGKNNSPITHQKMIADLGLCFDLSEDIALEDLDYTVTAISEETVAVVLKHSGLFFEEDGSRATDVLLLGWKLSLVTGQIESVE